MNQEINCKMVILFAFRCSHIPRNYHKIFVTRALFFKNYYNSSSGYIIFHGFFFSIQVTDLIKWITFLKTKSKLDFKYKVRKFARSFRNYQMSRTAPSKYFDQQEFSIFWYSQHIIVQSLVRKYNIFLVLKYKFKPFISLPLNFHMKCRYSTKFLVVHYFRFALLIFYLLMRITSN